ncbi:MAG: T9SS C-terminal target domain-containing protein, partial [Crocinitomicaceae bacterium]|nr:T9SS C-terminal target domain-containing protein [Crocinitomicaceae bacterium]
MKNIIFSIFTLLLSFNLNSQKDYYFYGNEKIEFNIDFQHLLIITENNFDNSLLKNLIPNNFDVISLQKSQDLTQIIVLKFSDSIDSSLYQKIVEVLYKEERISYVTYGLFDEHTKRIMYFSNVFNLCLMENQSFEELKNLENKFKISLVSQTSFMKNWYSFSTDKKSIMTCSELCKLLTSQKFFKHSEPEIINGFHNTCVNDTYFGNQWYLNNTGQNSGTIGVDIKVCDAWNVTSGSEEVITAVIDDGLDVTNPHPDLAQSIYPTSYDAYTQSTTSFPWAGHGTACAGIIAASSNNNEGISGVAPNSKIMAISNPFGLEVNSTQFGASLVRSFNFAVEQNADIISNSWQGAPSSVLTAAISNALLNGRNGLGCVVVFSSGNNNSSNSVYPGNSNPQIINVGAVDKCGTRAGSNTNSCDPWPIEKGEGSSYGSTLDVVAGGSSIYTTDLQGTAGFDNTNYTSSFGGTSAACPQVSGVAALILSVNPCLTQQAVHDIICFSGQKLSNYSFLAQTGTSRERLGSWNNEVGHGLVDASLCVDFAKNLYIQKEAVATNKNWKYLDILIGEEVTQKRPSGAVVFGSSSTSEVIALESIRVKKGVHIQRGANVRLKTDANLICEYSNPIKSNLLNNELLDVEVDSQLERNKSEANIQFNLFPNPLTNQLHINSPNKFNKVLKIDIFSINGKLMFCSNLDFSKSENQIINFSEDNFLEAGIYFVNLTNESFSKS